MSVKTTLATGITVIALASGATALLTTPPANLDAQRREQQVQDLADADERSKSIQKENGDARRGRAKAEAQACRPRA